MRWVIAMVAVGIFLWLFSALAIVKTMHIAIGAVRPSFRTLINARCSDDQKEQAARQAAAIFLIAFLSTGVRMLTALLLGAMPVIAGDLMGIASWRSVATVLMRADVLALTVVATGILMIARIGRG